MAKGKGMFTLVCLLGALVGACLAKNMTLYTLSDHPDGSSCLDGSPYAYYFRPGNSTTKWVIHHQGGGWCYDTGSCYLRSKTILGSSTGWAQSIVSWLGILSDDPVANPNFYTWNAVILFYCDGSSFSGFREQPVQYNGKDLYFRGRNNLIAASNDLLNGKGLNKATDVIITGCSAGGLSTYIHLDFWRSIIQPSATVKGVGDAGWFLDANSIYGHSVYTPEMQSGFALWNSTEGLNQGCIQAHTPTNDTWKCVFSEYIYPHIQAPIFIVNSKNDNWQINNILRLPCYAKLSQCNSTEMDWFQQYAVTFENTLVGVQKSPKDGMFVTSCYTHCQTIDDTAWTKVISVTADGTKITPSSTFTNWYYSQPETKALDTCTYPCNPTCESY